MVPAGTTRFSHRKDKTTVPPDRQPKGHARLGKEHVRNRRFQHRQVVIHPEFHQAFGPHEPRAQDDAVALAPADA